MIRPDPLPVRGCSHLEAVFDRDNPSSSSDKFDLFDNYQRLIKIVYPSNEEDYRLKAYLSRCAHPNCTISPVHIMICYSCMTCLCVPHIAQHLRKHNFAIALNFGTVFCRFCDDYVYEQQFEEVRLQQRILHQKFLGFSADARWQLGNGHVVNVVPRVRAVINGSDHNLRGIHNLGSTCFINVIIQALVHTPSVRDFFLSDGHVHEVETQGVDREDCLMCMIEDAFHQLLEPQWKEAVVLTEFLSVLWRSSDLLRGYTQQDAHEFLITLLEKLSGKGNRDVFCGAFASGKTSIIDTLFSGEMTSGLRCRFCGHGSARTERCIDVALDILDESEPTLEQCLNRYVSSEYLSCSNCEQCGEKGIIKQMTFHKLPSVTIFQLKRFNHVGDRRQKINTHVKFPLEIDMSQYLDVFDGNVSEYDVANTGALAALNRLYNTFELYAVVQHVGSLDTGHYTCFVRKHNRWFKCDDSKVFEVAESDVHEAECYLLFYQAKTIKIAEAEEETAQA